MSDKKQKPQEGPDSDDVVFDEVLENTGRDHTETIKKIKEKLKDSEKEKQEYLDGWQRAKADLINARRQDEERAREMARFAEADLISEIIPVLDSFDMAFSNKEAWEKAPAEWRTGVEYIHSQLLKVLESRGVHEISPKVGEAFDHHTSEAIETVPVEKAEDDHVVLQVLRRGYRMNGKVIHPARVKVGEYKADLK